MPQQEKLAKLARMQTLRNLMTFSVRFLFGSQIRRLLFPARLHTAITHWQPLAKIQCNPFLQDVPEGTLDAPAAIVAMVQEIVSELEPLRKKQPMVATSMYRKRQARQQWWAKQQSLTQQPPVFSRL